MKIYRLQRTQCLPIDLGKAWGFFSDASNLPEITPSWMKFQVLSLLPKQIYPGMIAIYKVQPFKGIMMNWVTEITHVIDQQLFVDEQRFGPYSFWHHEHHFSEVPGGVKIDDIIHYALPLGPLGRLAHQLIVINKLQQVFDYRFQELEKRFGTYSR